MFHPRVKGTYYEMGYNYGTILHEHGFTVPEQPSEKLEFSRKSEKEVRRIFPEVLEEIKGFADACQGSYEHLSALILGVGAFKVTLKCSVFAAFNGSDVVFGRNYDFYYSFKKYTEGYLTCPNDGYWSVGHSDVFVGREDGVNEKGLAIAMTGIDGLGPSKPGVSFCLALRRVLDKCASVQEGVDFLLDTHFASANNYLLADKEGDMAVVEATPDRVRVRRPEKSNNFIACTNHFVLPEMLELENVKARCWDSVPRYTAICNALKKKGKIGVKDDAQEILSNHSGYVCSHQEKIKLGTLWSVVATLKQLQILRAEGHPCRTKYKPDSRLNKALQRKSKPR